MAASPVIHLPPLASPDVQSSFCLSVVSAMLRSVDETGDTSLTIALLQVAANAATCAALAQHAPAAQKALSEALDVHGRAAQAAADKQQRLLVAALLRHQKANEAMAAAALRGNDAQAHASDLTL